MRPTGGRSESRTPPDGPPLPLPQPTTAEHPRRGPKGEMIGCQRRRRPRAMTARPSVDLDDDRLREECGVFGIFGHPDAAAITALGLHALQHRGQEAAGIVSFDGKRFHSERRMGLVGDNFSRREVIDRLPGTRRDRPCPLFDHRRDHPAQRAAAVRRARRRRLRHRPQRQPHQRPDAAPPTRARRRDHAVDHRHRGDPASRRALASATASSTASSTGCASSKAPIRSSALTNKKLIGARDPLGIRPLVIGELDGYPILASETCALDIIGAHYVRDVENGEVVVFDEKGVQSHKPFPPMPPRPCIFEYIYFSRPDSIVGGRAVYDVRKTMGAELAREAPARRRRGRAGAGFRRAGRDRLRAGIRHPLRARHHPQPLCRPHLHRADAADPPARRAAEALAPTARW